MKIWNILEDDRPILENLLRSLKSSIGMEGLITLKVGCKTSKKCFQITSV
jgi:hypothetical protein